MRRTAILLDLLAVLIFVGIGRSVHGHADTPVGFLSTTWPFATGLIVAWTVVWRSMQQTSLLWQGVVIAAMTVVIGMVLRVVGGQGTAFAFVLVALGFLGAVMVGWRLIYCALRSRSR